MGTRVQFNPSTLKVSYNPNTSKVQVIPCDCTLCTVVPFVITVTFEDLVDETDCCDYDGVNSSKIYDGGLAASLNGEHELVCNGTICAGCGSGVVGECCWSKRVTGSFGTVDFHIGNGCGNFTYDFDVTRYDIAVTVFESLGTKYTYIRVLVYGVTCPGNAFVDTLTFVDAADCLNLGNTFTNEVSCDVNSLCAGGTAVITL